MSDLARVLFQSGHYSVSKGRVKPGAFHPKAGSAELSVLDIRELEGSVKVALAARIAVLQGRQAKGHAEFPLTALESLPLWFERDDQPIERHGNLLGWPNDGSDHAEMGRHRCSVALAASSALFLH